MSSNTIPGSGRRLLAVLLWAFLGLLCGAHTATAQSDEDLPEVTRTFALIDARIVQAPGRTIDEGTVVIRDGLITAVGDDVDIPYDAERIDADSLTIYAGFIDGLSHAGMPEPEMDREDREAAAENPGDPRNDLAGIQPDRRARDLLEPSHERIEQLRKAGFTTAHVVPRGGMLPGTGAVISLAGSNDGEMIVESAAGLFARFGTAPDMYPETDMGVLARLRQLYREAERRRQARAIFAANPEALTRPPQDPVHQAFLPVINGERSIYFHTENALSIHRAIALQVETEAPMVLTGLRQSFETVEALQEVDLPLFLSLDLPEHPPAEGDTAATADIDPGAYEPNLRTESYRDVEAERRNLLRRQQLERNRYLSTAATLHEAGLAFGFTTREVDAGDILENLRTIVEHGLPEEQAIAALTTIPAERLRLSRSMGTVDSGKAANLVVTSGPLFDRKSQVEYVFVDGRKFRYDADDSEKKEEAVENGDQEVQADQENIERAARANDHRRTSGATFGTVLVQNGTVLTVTNGTLENADVLVEDGTITAVGQDLEAPEGVQTVDASGKYVMPGIVDAHAHIAIDDINEATNPVTSEVGVGDILDPYDLDLYRALAGGVTVTHTMHGSANVIGGRNETIKHRYGQTHPEALKMEGAPHTIKFALGENPITLHGESHRVVPTSRMGVEFVIREALNRAKRYDRRWDEFRSRQADGERVTPPEYSERLEILAGVLAGDIQVHCHSYRSDEILMLMKVLEDFGVDNVTFQHVNEGFKIAPELAEFGAGASVFSDWWAYKFEVYYSTAYNAAILEENGVLTSINSDSPELNRHLYHEAAKTQKYGDLSDTQALSLITINPARQLGIADRVGSIEVGKDGDLAIFNAHPLSIYAICQRTIVDGVTRFDRQADPDDMRLRTDPETSVPPATLRTGEENHRCLRGVDLYEFMQKALDE